MFRIIFWTVIVVLLLSFFGISIQSIVNSPVGQANFAFVGGLLADIYHLIVNSIGTAIEWVIHFFSGLYASIISFF